MSKERDLILPGIPTPGGVWAELGSGGGIFTLALLEVAGPQIELYSVDRDAKSLEKQRRAIAARYPDARVTYLHADFSRPIDLPELDGILMANALHFTKFDQQQAVLRQICTYLKPTGGKLILVEYEARRGNPWVPYPVDYESFQYLGGEAGLSEIRRLAMIPSSFMGSMYSAIGVRHPR